MWHIIIGILTWIGIILLSLLALLLLLVLLVLFLPIRYRFQAAYEESLNGSGWVRWFYPVFELRLQVKDNSPKTEIRIFGRLLENWKKSFGRRKGRKRGKGRGQRKGQKQEENKKLPEQKEVSEQKEEEKIEEKEEKEKKTEPQQKTEESSREKFSEQKKVPEQKEEKEKIEEKKAEPQQKTEETSREETLSEKEPPEQKEVTEQDFQNQAEEKQKTGFFSKIRAWFMNLWNRLLAILNAILEVWQKIKGLWGNWEQILELWQQETTKTALSLLWQECKKLLLALKPKKYSLWLHYGTGDVYTLAQHLRILAIVYGLCGGHVTIEPDWEKKVILAKGSVKGQIRIFTLARICIKVVTDKNVKRLWKQISEWERS